MPHREWSGALRHLMHRRGPTAVQWPSGVEACNDRRATGLDGLEKRYPSLGGSKVRLLPPPLNQPRSPNDERNELLRRPTLRDSGSRTNVPVRAEQVLRVVFLLDLNEAVEVGAVGRPNTLLAFVGGLEVEVVASC
jgi:hypothetical protein